MTSISNDPEHIRDCYLASLDSTEQFIYEIGASNWENPTPCDEWNVRDVVNHLVYENLWAVELFNGKTIEDVGDSFEGDLFGDAPLQKYLTSGAEIKKIIERPESMSAICNISSGPVPGSEYAAQLFLDTLIHGWDIAVGSNQEGKLNIGLVEACMPLATLTRDAVGESGPFGSTVEKSQDQDAQTRLLALLGRDSSAWNGPN